jgi:DNA-binding NarL/FixJ family response regulator
VAALQAFFEQTWMAATPLGLSISPKGNELDATQRTVLELLALGYVDHEVGTKMALDKRTIRRRVAEIMKILGAKSRFQAGANAAKHGLI